jgi:hypothetical protein
MTDLFAEDQSANTEQEAVNPLDSLVGEGKKFSTVEDLAKGKTESDAHIAKIEDEALELRKKIAELESAQAESKTFSDVISAIDSKGQGEANHASLTSEQVASLINEQLNNRSAADQASTNRDSVNSAVLAKFQGDAGKAKAFIASRASEVGVSTEQLKQMSEQTPQVVTRLLGINDTQPQNPQSIGTGFRGDAGVQSETTRNFRYYEGLRKEMGDAKYFRDITLQQQKLKDSELDGFMD